MKEMEWGSRNTYSLILEKMKVMLAVNVSQSPRDFWNNESMFGKREEMQRIICNNQSYR